MKQAKPTDIDFQATIDFLNGLEAIFEYGQPPEGTSLNPRDSDNVVRWIEEQHNANCGSFSRVLWGGKCCIENACDPDCDVLEFRPDIRELLANAKSDSETEQLKEPT